MEEKVMLEGVQHMQDEIFPVLITNVNNPSFKCYFAYTTCFDDPIHVSAWGDDGFILDICEGSLVEYYKAHKNLLPEFLHHFIKSVYEGK